MNFIVFDSVESRTIEFIVKSLTLVQHSTFVQNTRPVNIDFVMFPDSYSFLILTDFLIKITQEILKIFTTLIYRSTSFMHDFSITHSSSKTKVSTRIEHIFK